MNKFSCKDRTEENHLVSKEKHKIKINLKFVCFVSFFAVIFGFSLVQFCCNKKHKLFIDDDIQIKQKKQFVCNPALGSWLWFNKLNK